MVPTENLTRRQKPPSKEILRLFIRCNAIRFLKNTLSIKVPWIVDKQLVRSFFWGLFWRPCLKDIQSW